MDLVRLKRETAAEHSMMESLVPLMSPALKVAQYLAVLRRFYGFIRSWEVWAEANAPEELRPMLLERKRSSYLEADLRYFGEPLPMFQYAPPAPCTASPAAFLGAMYVVEGSTLGGLQIARHVEGALSLLPGQGNSYFRGYGERTGSMWRELQKVIESVHEEESGDVITGAKNMFSAFASWMRDLEVAETLMGDTVGVT